MTARSDPGSIRTILIDAGEQPTDDPSWAARGEVVEVAPDGSIVADYPGLAWSVDPGSLDGNEGQSRPGRDVPLPESGSRLDQSWRYDRRRRAI